LIANVPQLQTALNFFTNLILGYYGCSQIAEMFRNFKGFITYLYVNDEQKRTFCGKSRFEVQYYTNWNRHLFTGPAVTSIHCQG